MVVVFESGILREKSLRTPEAEFTVKPDYWFARAADSGTRITVYR